MYRIGDEVTVPLVPAAPIVVPAGDEVFATLKVQRVDGNGGIVTVAVVDGGVCSPGIQATAVAAVESSQSSSTSGGKLAEFELELAPYALADSLPATGDHVPENKLAPVVYRTEEAVDAHANTEVLRNKAGTISVVSEYAAVRETSTAMRKSERARGAPRLPVSIAIVAAAGALAGAVWLSAHLFATHRRQIRRRVDIMGQRLDGNAVSTNALAMVPGSAFDAL
jgi:hypothetical protein